MVYMKHLIVGHGEVGKALHKVLGEAYWEDVDNGTWRFQEVDFVHICIPFSGNFKETVKTYTEFGFVIVAVPGLPACAVHVPLPLAFIVAVPPGNDATQFTV